MLCCEKFSRNVPKCGKSGFFNHTVQAHQELIKHVKAFGLIAKIK